MSTKAKVIIGIIAAIVVVALVIVIGIVAYRSTDIYKYDIDGDGIVTDEERELSAQLDDLSDMVDNMN